LGLAKTFLKTERHKAAMRIPNACVRHVFAGYALGRNHRDGNVKQVGRPMVLH
jgi:hypothetical protein